MSFIFTLFRAFETLGLKRIFVKMKFGCKRNIQPEKIFLWKEI